MAEKISQIAVGLLLKFLEEHENSEDEMDQILCYVCNRLYLKHLQSRNSCLYSSIIRNSIEQEFGVTISQNRFKSQVIAKLRDHGVIVASSTSGYKIPASTRDIELFCKLVENTVFPYLERLSHARDIFLSGTNCEYDILADENFKNLNQLIRIIKLSVAPNAEGV